ncbi:hypothetical protein G6677_03885, partial [Polynucleobacter paneuropaeus]|nr:hypothetical protein [Polynucleobacter paneuropaeus]
AASDTTLASTAISLTTSEAATAQSDAVRVANTSAYNAALSTYTSTANTVSADAASYSTAQATASTALASANASNATSAQVSTASSAISVAASLATKYKADASLEVSAAAVLTSAATATGLSANTSTASTNSTHAASDLTSASAAVTTTALEASVATSLASAMKIIQPPALPITSPELFTIQGQTNVSTWKVSTTWTSPLGVVTTDYSYFHQDPSGNNITFSTHGNPSAGTSVAISVQGYDGSGVLVSPGQGQVGFSAGIGLTSYMTTTLHVQILGIDANGNVTGALPSTYSASDHTVYILIPASDPNGVFTANALNYAYSHNSVLAQYVAAGQVALINLADSVQPNLYYNPIEAQVAFGNSVVPILHNSTPLGWSGPIAIKSAASSIVEIWVSNGSSSSQVASLNLTAGIAKDIWGVIYPIATSSINSYKIYFTDGYGNPLSGLQLAVLPVSGGILTANNWINLNAYTNSVNGLNVYSGTVAQILAVSSPPAGSLFLIKDTISHIQSGGLALYNLVNGGQVMGAVVTDGFDAIAMSNFLGHTPVPISDGNGHTAYLRVDIGYSSSGVQAHSALAINTATVGSVTIFIDGSSVATLSTNGGTVGWQIPQSVITNLSSGQHTISLTAGAGINPQVGMVPAGGGWPSSYSNSLSIWIGTAAQLPTSLADVDLQNTLYVIRDTIANITTLDNRVAGLTGVMGALANTGHLAYSTPSMGWAQYHQITELDLPIANVSPVIIGDSAYALSKHFTSDINAGESFAIRDHYARLVSPSLAFAAQYISAGYPPSTVLSSPAQISAFANHQIYWIDSLEVLSNQPNTKTMAGLYYGSNPLGGVQVTDTVFNLQQLTSVVQTQNITNFVNSNANGNIIIDIRDSFANVYSALHGGGASAFQNQLASVFIAATSMSSRVEVQDTVANIKAAFDNGQLSALNSLAQNFLTNTPLANVQGLHIRIQDTVANIESFLADSSYVIPAGLTSAFIVDDSATNIVADQSNYSGAIALANNVWVRDTYTQVVANAGALFSSVNHSNGEVTKVIFTDVTGADAAHPLVISPTYNNGQLPILDFSAANGLQGQIVVTESLLSKVEVANLVTSYANAAGAKSGIAITVTDTAGHVVVVDVLSTTYSDIFNMNPDGMSYDLKSVVLPTMPYVTADPVTLPAGLPSVAHQAIMIQGNSAVAYWLITMTHTNAAGSVVNLQTYRVLQDASGDNIAFGPNLGGPIDPINVGDQYTFTAQGFNGGGSIQVASGQIGMNSPVFSSTSSTTFSIVMSGLDNAGVPSYLPASYSDNQIVFLIGPQGSAGQTGLGSYSLSNLTNALTNNTTLAQYAAHYQLLVGGLENTVGPTGVNPNNGTISVNGQVLSLAGGGQLDPWEPVAMQSPTVGSVVQHISYNGGSYQTSTGTNIDIGAAGVSQNISQWAWNLTNNSGSLSTTRVYFTDTLGAAISGLKIANLPVSTGGVLNGSSWLNVGSGQSSVLTIYSGTVSQIKAAAATAPTNSLFFINDSIENIQSGGATLYNLIASGQILGSTVNDGFDGIALMSTSALSSIWVSNGAGQGAYVQVSEGGTWTGAQAHSVLAINSTVAGSVSVFIDGQLAQSASYSIGTAGLVLSQSFLDGLAAGMHTLSLFNSGGGYNGVGSQIGIVPPGGGWPTSYSNSLKIWVGSAAQLPTSIADISANTLYIISDTSANITSLDGFGSVMTEVLSDLASTGYLAFNITPNGSASASSTLHWAQYSQILHSQNNFPIANVSNFALSESAYVIENKLWDLPNGISPSVYDVMGRLLAPNIALGAFAMSSGSGSNLSNFIFNDALKLVMNNHQMYWVDSASSLNSGLYQSSMGSIYFGANGQLGGVDVRDTVANLSALTASGETNLISFANSHASGSLQVAIQDTVANTYAALVTANPSSLESKLATDFAGISTHLASHVQIMDTVAALEAAYDNGHLAQIQAVANTFFNNVNPTASNLGLDLRVNDSLANINALLYSGHYSPLDGMVSSFIVTDSATNLANSFNNDDWSTVIQSANNIVVQDTYSQILANQAILFNWGQSNNGNGEITKVIFTDLSTADASHPIIVNLGYSYVGRMPLFDFNSAGFSGAVTVTERGLTQSAAQAINSNAYSGELITLTDTSNKQVVIDILSYNANYSSFGNPADPFGVDLASLVLPSNGNLGNATFNLAAGANILSGSYGPSATNFMSILNWGGSDNIQYSSPLSVTGFNGTAVAGKASIASSGLTTFYGSDTTLAQQIQAAEAAIHAVGPSAAGHIAYWDNNGSTYVLITGDNNAAGNTVSMNDDLVKLVGIDHTHVALSVGHLIAQ